MSKQQESWFIPGEGWYIEFTHDGQTDFYGPISHDDMQPFSAQLWRDAA